MEAITRARGEKCAADRAVRHTGALLASAADRSVSRYPQSFEAVEKVGALEALGER
jgi:hypothetical protein